MFRVLFLFDEEVEFGPFRFNMFPLIDRQRRGKYDSGRRSRVL